VQEQRANVTVGTYQPADAGQPMGVTWLATGIGLWIVGQAAMLMAGSLPLAPGGILIAALLGLAMWGAGLSVCMWRLFVSRKKWAMIVALVLGLILVVGLFQAVQVLRAFPAAG